ncbi:hypothetical protein THRCLA_21929 [Thraustotheca clavata]|uniref:Helicase-associated domain-containing protein n=1 Tax=Thraustotheca clavata TaxID=74557 RepID=A0A1V9ZHL7_9STRA|nr:hypothetical protein THRCLA_21929 [Thraustotheca clavata]
MHVRPVARQFRCLSILRPQIINTTEKVAKRDIKGDERSKRPIKPHQKVWTTTIQALEHYKQLHGHLMIPQSFKIDNHVQSEWPKEMWNISLGRVVNKLRTEWKNNSLSEMQLQVLERLEFPFYGRTTIPWSTKLQALKTFKEHYGHVNIRLAFVVPSSAEDESKPWPKELHKLKLGKVVNSLRNQQDSLLKEQKKQLDSLGFIWSSWELAWKTKLIALEQYKILHGNLYVPRQFIVPKEEPWPESVWGLKLGLAVNNFRGRPDRLTLGQVKALAELDFPWDSSNVPFAIRIDAWKIYESIHDTNKIPPTFIVPSGPNWPEKYWGIPLGKLTQSILQKPERLTIEELLELYELGYFTPQ